ncbi:MAG: hypothetical protein M3P27_09705 [Acidobacteriota bacterium]|nr:hypothetical protein [Acidobacteriota bacterium]
MTMMRTAMNPAGRRWRAYFAPVDRVAGTSPVFDPALDAGFLLDAPATPWVDLGWIEDFKRSSATETVAVRGGSKQALARQARKQLAAQVEFDFCDWGKLQLALAGGSQQMNVLASGAGTRKPSGAAAVAAVPLIAGSTATQIMVGAGAIAGFDIGDLVAVDIDYAAQTGYVGSGLAGAFVKAAADVGSNADYIRRITFNVGRIAAKEATAFTLAQPLLGGVPPAGAKAQKVIGFTDREGGAFFQEWSGLFIFESEAGGRVILYYPRLQAAAAAAESKVDIADPLRALALHARCNAFPRTDANDAEQALCWRTYYPAPSAALY